MVNPVVGGEWVQYHSFAIASGRWGFVTNSGTEYLLLGENDSNGDYFQTEFNESGGNLWIQFAGTGGVEDLPVVNATFAVTGGTNTYWSISLTTSGSISTLLGYDGDTTRNVKVWFADPGLTKEPLAEGDILQWVDADQKFKPAQLPSGGGGAVDSVNGETGVVSLGIQDMDDFELSPGVDPIRWTFDVIDSGQASGGLANGKAFIDTTNTSVSPITNDGQDVKDALRAWVAAIGLTGTDQDIVFTVNGVDYTASVTTVEDTLGGSGSYGPRLRLGTSLRSQSGAAIGGSLKIKSFNEWAALNGYIDTSPNLAPLAEGDILQWNNTDQKFKPAQSPINSVNGETGVVSLGIQDMDDFELNRELGSGYPYRWRTTASNGFPIPGEAAPGGSTNWHLSIDQIDNDGNDNTSDFQKLLDNNITEITLSSGLTSETYAVTNIGNGGFTMMLDLAGQVFLNGLNDNVILFVNSPLFTDAPDASDIPLYEGDYLKWDANDEVFKPAQLPAGGAVDSVNGETGVVSLGIQDMGDFELSESPDPTTIYRYVPNTQGQGINSGEWYWDGGSGLYFFRYDADGVQSSPTLKALSQPGSIWISIDDGVTYTEMPFDTVENGVPSSLTKFVGTQISATLTAIGVVQNSSNLRIATGNPQGPTPLLLADGDVLQWDDADQAFKPVQLDPVDSVNGETGVVNLGVQDMDDFRLNVTTGTSLYYHFTTANNAPFSTPAGGWDVSSNDITMKFPDQNGLDGFTEFLNHDYSQGVWVSPDATSWTQITGVSMPFNSPSLKVVGLRAADWGPFQVQIEGAYADGDFYIALGANPGITPVPLANGDTLHWVDAEQKFKPVQRVTKIQDMDDFALEDDPSKQSNPTYAVDWSWFGVNSSAAGSHVNGNFVSTTSNWWISPFTENDDDLKTILRDWVATLSIGDTINVRFESTILGVVSEAFTYDGVSDQMDDSGTSRPRLTFSGALATDGGSVSNHTTNFRILNLEQYAIDNGLATPVAEEAPLYEGDILRWNDTDKKFKPAGLIDKATLQSVVAASSDFADFQSRIAAL